MPTLKTRIKLLEQKTKLDYPIMIIGQNTEASADQQIQIQQAEAQNKQVRIIRINVFGEDNI